MGTNEQERSEGLIDIPTAAARLGLGISTLRRKINEGEVPAYRMGEPGSVIRIDPRELDEWLRQPEEAA
jgi:excisionase family DNA binding protein